MAESYTIYIKDPKSGQVKKVSFGKSKQDEENHVNTSDLPVDDSSIKKVDENINIPVKIGDTILTGKFKNKKITVKEIGKDEHGMPTINGKKVVTFRKMKEGIEIAFANDKEEDKDLGELLTEIIDSDSINIENLKIKNNLCPKIWDSGDKMNAEVRQTLLKNALEFIRFSKIENLKFKDIILTGSLANYNWHEGSDLDVHVLMDYNQISDDNDFVSDYFKTKKNLWSEKLPIKVKGHDVEMYIQNTEESHTSTGVYSILNDKWITKPIKTMVSLDIPNIKAKSKDFINAIDELESTVDSSQIVKEIDRLMDKLKEYRKAGLEEEGEFSTENLVFKVLRNSGYLEKLATLKQNTLTKELSLENISNSDGDIINEVNTEKIKNLVKKGTITLGVVISLLSSGVAIEDAITKYEIPIEMIKKAEEYLTNMNSFFDISKQKIKNKSIK